MFNILPPGTTVKGTKSGLGWGVLWGIGTQSVGTFHGDVQLPGTNDCYFFLQVSVFGFRLVNDSWHIV